MNKQLNLAVVTGTRAEYGLLRPVLQRAFADPDVNCSLLVTGAHLRPEYGNTVTEIENDGFPIAAKFDILQFGSDEAGVMRTVSHTVGVFGEWFAAHPVDACLVLGDRYEIFAVASAAALQHIPVVHISGGDVTWGAQDDWFRHCITKMSALHFPYCEAYRQRLLRMGEEPARVFNVGALGTENIRSLPLLDVEALAQKFDFDFSRPYLLITFHPETLSPQSPAAQLAALLTALDALPDMGFCITGANADVGGSAINDMWRQFVAAHPRAKLYASMGLQGYLSAMKHCAAVVGNSSSGVVETPEFGVPCVNIGLRQGGRITCDNVLSCPNDSAAILAAIQKAVSPAFTAAAAKVESPFYKPDTAGQIIEITKAAFASGLLHAPKHFYDGPDGQV